MKNFNRKLEKYAELAVKAGINLKAKESLLIIGNAATLPLARKIMKIAYELGATDVEFKLVDDEMKKIRYNYGKEYVFEQYPQWRVDSLEAMYKAGYQHLYIDAPDPTLLEEIDTDLIAKDQKVYSQAVQPIMKYRMTGTVKWNIIAMPSLPWAKSVFPNLSEKKAIEALWEKIFDATRINSENPVKAWKTHDEMLKKYKDFLNQEHFEKLVFEGPKTELECFLATDHHWMGGSKKSTQGDSFIANIPTEEVFTTPHYKKVNGKLHSTKALNLNGKIVEDFGFTFKDGKVVDFYAAKGYDVIEKLLENDTGAKFLGEVALVPDDSPISNTNLLFKNTLFDENASVHFALGKAYPYAIKNGTKLSKEALMEKGANDSLIHVDFMVGGPALNITAYKKDGTAVKLFKNGNWNL